MLVLLEGAL